MKRAFLIALLVTVAVPSVFAASPIPLPRQLPRPVLTATPPSPVTLGTPVVLTVTGETPSKSDLGELVLFSFSAKRAGEELQIVRPFAPEVKAKWIPARAGTYEVLATMQLKRHNTVVAEMSTTLTNYIVNAPPSGGTQSGGAPACGPNSPCRGKDFEVGSCVDGACKFDCRPGLTRMTIGAVSVCVDLQANGFACGNVGTACPADMLCSAGQCVAGVTSCAPLRSCRLMLGGATRSSCVNPQTDPLNCGDCGQRCSYGENCVNGNCKLTQQP